MIVSIPNLCLFYLLCCFVVSSFRDKFSCADRKFGSQVAIDSLKNTGTDPLREATGPHLGPIASRWRSVWPSLKYADGLKNGAPSY